MGMRRLINDKQKEEENLLSKIREKKNYYENQTSKKSPTNCFHYNKINSFSPCPRCFLEILAKIQKHFSSNASYHGPLGNTCEKYMFCTVQGLCPFPVEGFQKVAHLIKSNILHSQSSYLLCREFLLGFHDCFAIHIHVFLQSYSLV